MKGIVSDESWGHMLALMAEHTKAWVKEAHAARRAGRTEQAKSCEVMAQRYAAMRREFVTLQQAIEQTPAAAGEVR